MLLNKNDLAKAQGLKVFDCALPQTWLDKISAGNEAIYNMLCCYCVWCYDEARIFGAPVGLNTETKTFLTLNKG